MSLCSCPDCGGSVSDRAFVCVHCGAPLQTHRLILTFELGPHMCALEPISIFSLDSKEMLQLYTATTVAVPIYGQRGIYAQYGEAKSQPLPIFPDRDNHVTLALRHDEKLKLATELFHAKTDPYGGGTPERIIFR